MTDLSIKLPELQLALSVYGDPNAPAVLFLHGLGNSRDTWNEVAAALAQDHEVWTLDFRGHGHSGFAQQYEIRGYAEDAGAVLQLIGRPTAIVGHSLGGVVAGMLAQTSTELVRRVFLSDPPWYLGDSREYARTAFGTTHPLIAKSHREMTARRAPLSDFVEFVSNVPSSLGGTNKNHISYRHLLSHASALQRMDSKCWADLAGGHALAPLDPKVPFQCPATILQADSRYGAALLDDHAKWLSETNPGACIRHYEGCGHNPHRTDAFAAQFLADVRQFLQEA
ncbi:MAG: alpha/beta hydrolase [Xenophilus sp.]